jgi:2-polyprenyl-3-methyl-5-hydroxy-6-metoxy-1,4-benzoquinol methylase
MNSAAKTLAPDRPLDYFEHYQGVNDLSAAGRRSLWFHYRKLFAPLLPQDRGARILDFGCGAGLLVEWLVRDMGYRDVTGVDADAGQVAFARHIDLPVEHAEDATGWLARRGQFDAVILKDVLEHVPDGEDHALLLALNAALRAGGTLILTVPNANSAFAPRYRYIDPTHQRSYTEHTLAYALRQAGFEATHVGADDVWAPRSALGAARILVKLVARGFRRFEALGEFGPAGARLPLSLNLLAVARKLGAAAPSNAPLHGHAE